MTPAIGWETSLIMINQFLTKILYNHNVVIWSACNVVIWSACTCNVVIWSATLDNHNYMWYNTTDYI